MRSHSPLQSRQRDRRVVGAGPLAAALLLAAGFALADPGSAPPPSGLAPALSDALAATGDRERGRAAYASCSVCHGADGAGLADGTFPQLAGQHATVITKQLVDIRSGMRANPIMLPFAARLMDAQEIADVAAYVSALPPPPQRARGPGEQLELGARLYLRDCARCHGSMGEGSAERIVPALAGQHYGYLLRQIRDIGAGRRRNAHPEMAALAEGYEDAELRALVDYASRLEPRLEPRPTARID